MKFKPRPTLQQSTKLYEMIKEFSIKNNYNMKIICNKCNSEKNLIKENGIHYSAYCENCNSFIKHLKKNDYNITIQKTNKM